MTHNPNAQAARSLAQALASDPFYRAVSVACHGDEALRLDILQGYFALALLEGEQAGRVDLADADGRGAAIWAIDAAPGVREAAYAQRLAGMQAVLGEQGLANFKAIVHNMEAAMAGQALGDAWYLSILGIAPEAQGRGLGASVLAGGLAAADRAGKACFLETYNERSLAFYASLGFEVVEKYAEAVTGCDYWLMLRAAR